MTETIGKEAKVLLGKKLREAFSAQICHRLMLLKVSVPAFAKKINLPKNTLARTIRCENAAGLDIVALVAHGFGVEASELLEPVKAEDRLRKTGSE